MPRRGCRFSFARGFGAGAVLRFPLGTIPDAHQMGWPIATGGMRSLTTLCLQGPDASPQVGTSPVGEPVFGAGIELICLVSPIGLVLIGRHCSKGPEPIPAAPGNAIGRFATGDEAVLGSRTRPRLSCDKDTN